MDPASQPPKNAEERLPRLRGDGPWQALDADGVVQVAPPTRGWTPVGAVSAISFQGCPAYAGMDPEIPQHSLYLIRLPRLRGDGPLSGRSCVRARKVAPPTRGWTFSNSWIGEEC